MDDEFKKNLIAYRPLWFCFYLLMPVLSYMIESRNPAAFSFAIGAVAILLAFGDTINSDDVDLWKWLCLHMFGIIGSIGVLYLFGQSWPRWD